MRQGITSNPYNAKPGERAERRHDAVARPEAQHTPGPWHARALRPELPDCYVILHNSNGGARRVDSGPARGVFAEADARLIARAPELLAECEKLRAEMKRQWDERCEKLRAAQDLVIATEADLRAVRATNAELLEALRGVLSYYKPETVNEMLAEREARAAIANATGGK